MLEKLGIFYDEKVQQLIDSFALCFKVRFTIFSSDCEDLILGFPYCPSSYCALVRDKIHFLPQCISQNRRMCQRCEHSRDPLTYRCHAGLHESVMPILVNKKLLGYAMIGQFRMKKEGEDEAAISPELLSQAKKAGIDADVLRETYLKLPIHSESLTQSMVNLFAVLINFIVMRDYINIHQPGLAEKISHWIDDHLTEPIKLDQAASAMYCSRSTICHTIKRQFGTSFTQLCILKRIQRFETLIAASPTLTIADAALKAGYDDPLYFSRVYKKIRLITPTAYARSIRKSGGIAES